MFCKQADYLSTDWSKEQLQTKLFPYNTHLHLYYDNQQFQQNKPCLRDGFIYPSHSLLKSKTVFPLTSKGSGPEFESIQKMLETELRHSLESGSRNWHFCDLKNITWTWLNNNTKHFYYFSSRKHLLVVQILIQDTRKNKSRSNGIARIIKCWIRSFLACYVSMRLLSKIWPGNSCIWSGLFISSLASNHLDHASALRNALSHNESRGTAWRNPEQQCNNAAWILL